MLFSEIVEKLRALSPIDLISCKHDEDITSIQFIDNKSECYNENTLYFSNNL